MWYPHQKNVNVLHQKNVNVLHQKNVNIRMKDLGKDQLKIVPSPAARLK